MLLRAPGVHPQFVTLTADFVNELAQSISTVHKDNVSAQTLANAAAVSVSVRHSHVSAVLTTRSSSRPTVQHMSNVYSLLLIARLSRA